MEIKKRGRWFQFHLSTFLAVTLMASVLVWVNLRPRWLGASQPQMITSYCYFEYGWPSMLFYQEVGIRTDDNVRWTGNSDWDAPEKDNFQLRDIALKQGIAAGFHGFSSSGMAIDTIAALALLSITVLVSERRARRTS